MDEWMKNEDAFIIFVDFTEYAKTTYFTTASLRVVHIVAAAIKKLIDYLYERLGIAFGIPISMINSVWASHKANWLRLKWQGAGHSLGVQILAALGHLIMKVEKSAQAKFGIFWCLDAAGFMFDQYKGVFPKSGTDFFRMESKYAHRVITLSTEWTCMGNKHAVGHINFYVNGPIEGADMHQPGCDADGIDPMPCSHQRVLNLFRYALRKPDNNMGLFGFPYNIEHRECPLIYDQRLLFSIHSADQLRRFGAAHSVYFMPTATCTPYQLSTSVNYPRSMLPTRCFQQTSNLNWFPWLPKVNAHHYTFASPEIKWSPQELSPWDSALQTDPSFPDEKS